MSEKPDEVDELPQSKFEWREGDIVILRDGDDESCDDDDIDDDYDEVDDGEDRNSA